MSKSINEQYGYLYIPNEYDDLTVDIAWSVTQDTIVSRVDRDEAEALIEAWSRLLERADRQSVVIDELLVRCRKEQPANKQPVNTFEHHQIPDDWKKINNAFIWFDAMKNGGDWRGVKGCVYKKPNGTFVAPFNGKLVEVMQDTKDEFMEI